LLLCVPTPLMNSLLPINFTLSHCIHQTRWINLLLARKAHKGQAFVHATLCLLENSSCLQLLSLPFKNLGAFPGSLSSASTAPYTYPHQTLTTLHWNHLFACVCLPSYSKIPRGQGTCLTHLQTPRQNMAHQSRNTELNCNQSGWPPHCPECILLILNCKLCSYQHLDNPTNDLGHSLQAQVSQGGLGFKPQALPTHVLCALRQDNSISESSSIKQVWYSTT